MKIVIQIILVVLFYSPVYGQNIFWERLDKKIIKQLAALNKTNPKATEVFFLGKKRIIQNKKEDLGFGYSTITAYKGGGYISAMTSLIYYKDSLIGCRIIAQLPDNKKKISKYKSWYGESFQWETDNKGLPFDINYQIGYQPLPGYNGPLDGHIPTAFQSYMSLESGTTYGYTGGYSNQMLSNRRAFTGLADTLTQEEVYLLLYSLNPASRLTAIEYYLKHKELFNQANLFERRIQEIFKETPTIDTMSGCIGHRGDSRQLVSMFSGIWYVDK